MANCGASFRWHMPDPGDGKRRGGISSSDMNESWAIEWAVEDTSVDESPTPEPELPGDKVLAALNDLLELPDEPLPTRAELLERAARQRAQKEAELLERIRKTRAEFAETQGKAAELLASLFMSQADLDRFSQRMDRDYEDLSVEFNKGFRRAVDDADATLSGLDTELDRMAREQIAGAGAAQRARLIAMLSDLQQQAEGHRQAAAELRRDAVALVHAAEEAIRSGGDLRARDAMKQVAELNEQARSLEAQADEIDVLVRQYIEQLDAAGSGPA